MERLICNACGEYFTATVADDVMKDGGVNQKYGYSARAMMAMINISWDRLFID